MRCNNLITQNEILWSMRLLYLIDRKGFLLVNETGRDSFWLTVNEV
jgi:hypothetical protein